MFDIPVVFFIFKRTEKSVEIVKQIGRVQPRKIYIISDAGRTEEEKREVERCRALVEQNIDWSCEVIRNYAEENRGCFDRIGLGALWVFTQEDRAIFLEDDNYPEITFFGYCREMLDRYQDDDRVLWVCGTNYLETYQTKDDSDYVFTQHMLPCGWASWSHKFPKCYDADFSNFNSESRKMLKRRYENRKLFLRDLSNWKMEINNRKTKGRFCSWDYQMCFSIRYHNKLGIAPRYNQIRNVGVDSAAAHGGTSYDSVMTQRFCGMGTKPLQFPLKHPKEVYIDEDFEAQITKIVLPPFELKKTLRRCASKTVRKILRIPDDQKIRDYVKCGRNRGTQ